MEKGDSKRIVWLDSIKLVACIGIMVSHFCSAFVELDKNAYAVDNLSSTVTLVTAVFSLFINGAFWVRIFCIVSGMLAAGKKVTTVRELLTSIVKRYFRFVIPFLGMGLVLWIIEKTVGYYAVECGEILQASWLGTHNIDPVTILDVLKMAFLFNSKIDGSLWTIWPIFAGSCCVYVLNYLLYKFNVSQTFRGVICIFLFLVSIIKYDINTLCMSCCVLGAGLVCVWNDIRLPQWLCNMGIVFVIVMMTGVHELLTNQLLSLGVDVPARFCLDGYGDVFYAGILLLCIHQSRFSERLLSNRVLVKSAYLSFPIYVFHMPIIMSLGALVCMRLLGKVSYTLNCAINICICMAATVLLSYLYTKGSAIVRKIVAFR